MVKLQGELDRVFAALADPTRRALLAQLRDHPAQSISELAQPFAISLPGVMKHLDVLSDAGLIARRKSGRTVTCELTAAPMQQALAWLERYEAFWGDQLDRLAAFVEDDPCPESPASPSSGGSKPRRPASTPPGPSRKP